MYSSKGCYSYAINNYVIYNTIKYFNNNIVINFPLGKFFFINMHISKQCYSYVRVYAFQLL